MATIEKRGEGDKVTYRVKVRLKGFPQQTASFQRITDAKKWAAATEAAIREGRYFKTPAAKKYTVGDLIDRYIAEVLVRKPKSIPAQKAQLLWWKQQLGSYMLSDLNASLIASSRATLASSTSSRKKPISPATVNRYIAAFSHALTIAVKEWEWLETNPINKVSKLKEPRGRVRFLSDEERTLLLKLCKESPNPYLYIVVVLALSTGARKMEILGLKWGDIAFTRQVIILHETKNGERRRLPLTGYALEVMQGYAKANRGSKADFVFPNKNNSAPMDIRTPWETVVRKAGLEDFRFHDLRHSAASYLAMSGASTHEIAEVLGHKTPSMVKRYSHLSESHTTSVVARMNDKIFS